MNIGIYVYDQVEVLDFAGPFEAFTTASRVHARQNPGASLFNVYLIAEQEGLTSARANSKSCPITQFTIIQSWHISRDRNGLTPCH